MSFAQPTRREWEMEPASFKQVEFLLRHELATRAETSNMTKGEASGRINGFRQGPKSTVPASDAQINFIKKLCSMLGLPTNEYILGEDGTRLTKQDAMATIPKLKAQLDEPLHLEEGLYQVGTNIYRVKKSDTGHFYVQKLIRLDTPEEVSNGIRTYKFVPSPDMRYSLRNVPRMTREQTQAFAQETSTCVRCGIFLEPTITQADGSPRYIGPVCEKKMGW